MLSCLHFDSSMDPSVERMPIACAHCAKAKAKCDKKVPCSRCVTKQIVCQSRPTKRSLQNPSRRSTIPRAHSERMLNNSAAFQISQLSNHSTAAKQDVPKPSPTSPHPRGPHRHRSTTDFSQIQQQPVLIASAEEISEANSQSRKSNFSNTPSDLDVPITPLLADMSHIDSFMSVNGTYFDADNDAKFLTMDDPHDNAMSLDAGNFLTDFMSPRDMIHDHIDNFFVPRKAALPMSGPHLMPPKTTPAFDLHLDPENNSHSLHHERVFGPSPSSSCIRSLQEADGVFAIHQAWPFFQCNCVEESSSPPKTAGNYLKGLAQTLRNPNAWSVWLSQLDVNSFNIPTERHISVEKMTSWSREKLLAITQGFLHKALDTHHISQTQTRDELYGMESPNESFLMLPPPDVMQYFIKSYVVRFEPFYSFTAGARLDPNSLIQCSNSKAVSLLLLLMVASGAMATATVEARYLASGLTEACRISLFDTIEKDVEQARDVLVLRSALLFACLAAWSGDKWHMNTAMAQRGMYLAMLTHAGMLDAAPSHIEIEACKADSDRAWENWKESEGRHRLAYSWVTVDQEMSLFSDTTPLLSVVDLHAPMPGSDDLWYAGTAKEWLDLLQKMYGTNYQSPDSVRHFFTKFVDGDLAGDELSPIQLRLLLHPLQAQVCQLRQFIACLPDGGSHQKASRTVSKAATKARLEEISSLLQQWYTITKRSFSGNRGTCWTTCANLIMYHLVSLNTSTSFKCIEQFARREVEVGASRWPSWLQMRCIDQPEEIYFHCGQILRLIRSMPKPVRPLWWAGAIYRVALVGWATGMSRNGCRFCDADTDLTHDTPFAIDDLTPEHESISKYMKYQEGTPMLTGTKGQLIPASNPFKFLRHCVDVLQDDSDMRLADGIKRKLVLLIDNWRDK